MSLASTVTELVAALRDLGPRAVQPPPFGAVEVGIFSGCGDSLSAALLAGNYGHRVVSSGDLAWFNGRAQEGRCLVALSYSGATTATVQAARRAKKSGLSTVAITPDAASPLALACAYHLAVPRIEVTETIPAAGHVAMSLGTLAACGADLAGAPALIASVLEELAGHAIQALERLPLSPCQGVSVLSLPDLRSSGDFWVLKFIEATGLAARSVPLEECGHVDYFIGPQPHLIVQLVGSQGRERHSALAKALQANGHALLSLDVAAHVAAARRHDQASEPVDDLIAIAVGALGASIAHEVAVRWRRTPFRGGAVDMSATHIQVAPVVPDGAAGAVPLGPTP